jgi:tight adherence protein B
MSRATTRARARLALATPPTESPMHALLLLAPIGLAAAWRAAGPTVALALATAAIAYPIQARIRHAAARRHLRAAQLPQALDRLAASLRSGISLPTALTEAATATPTPLGDELAALADQATRGRPIAAALDDWVRSHDDPATRLTATALVLATRVGSAPARAVDGVAATLRERQDLAAERRALSTQARTSAMVLAAAPIVFAAALTAGDTAAAHFLLTQPAGWTCLTIGLALDAAGAWWMSRLTRGHTP